MRSLSALSTALMLLSPLTNALRTLSKRSSPLVILRSATESANTAPIGKPKEKGNKASNAPPVGIDDIRKARVDKVELMRSSSVNPFAYTYAQTHKTAELQIQYKDLADGVEDPEAKVSVAGRIMVRFAMFFALTSISKVLFVYYTLGASNIWKTCFF